MIINVPTLAVIRNMPSTNWKFGLDSTLLIDGSCENVYVINVKEQIKTSNIDRIII